MTFCILRKDGSNNLSHPIAKDTLSGLMSAYCIQELLVMKEVISVLKALLKNKVTGIDGIPIKILQQL